MREGKAGDKIKQRVQIKEENKGRRGNEDKEPGSSQWAGERLFPRVGAEHTGRDANERG